MKKIFFLLTLLVFVSSFLVANDQKNSLIETYIKKSDLKLNISDLKFDMGIVKETVSLGFVTLSRQAAVSLTVLVVNNILFSLQGESMIAVYAIISRMLMFMLFPILGITQGFIPIAGYNFGAKNKDRVLNSVKKAIIYSTAMATVIFLFIYKLYVC